jgi:UDP-3-O-acyl-N-acetylglucosamine deacetylase
MADHSLGRVLAGTPEALARGYARFSSQPVDWDLPDEPAAPLPTRQTTLLQPFSIEGPGTFLGRHLRRLTFEPRESGGWWIQRDDLGDALPFQVAARNVWTTGDVVSNIVLRAGPLHNYLRMVEHIIALKIGLGLDHVLIRTDAGDPPLFVRGSLDLVEGLERAGLRQLEAPAEWWTVKEPVVLGTPSGAFLALAPCRSAQPELRVDCAVDFPNALGRQRIRFRINPALTRYASEARTNAPLWKMVYCKTIGKLFADIRNLGYTTENLLIAGRRSYYNTPRLLHEGKSLEAVWHRAVLDLLAALALIGEGRFCGEVTSFKAGHHLDVRLICQLYKHDLLCRV